MKTLHSILVKSILIFLFINPPNLKTLHSILVKSILCEQIGKSEHRPLYIPFWLNLYHTISHKLIFNTQLYIPFWLNLYSYNHMTLISAAKTPPFCRPRYYTYLVYQKNFINTELFLYLLSNYVFCRCAILFSIFQIDKSNKTGCFIIIKPNKFLFQPSLITGGKENNRVHIFADKLLQFILQGCYFWHANIAFKNRMLDMRQIFFAYLKYFRKNPFAFLIRDNIINKNNIHEQSLLSYHHISNPVYSFSPVKCLISLKTSSRIKY